MKKIVEYRKLLNVDKNVDLKELKTIYRNAMKDAHPDKFQGDEEGLKAAEENSKKIIEAYHFLVSINPETIKQNWFYACFTLKSLGVWCILVRFFCTLDLYA